MSVRAKFKCTSVLQTEGTSAVTLMAVTTGDDGANKSWSRWTPSGELKMTITNPAAFGQFVPGKEFYLDFTECSGEVES